MHVRPFVDTKRAKLTTNLCSFIFSQLRMCLCGSLLRTCHLSVNRNKKANI